MYVHITASHSKLRTYMCTCIHTVVTDNKISIVDFSMNLPFTASNSQQQLLTLDHHLSTAIRNQLQLQEHQTASTSTIRQQPQESTLEQHRFDSQQQPELSAYTCILLYV